MSPDEQSVHLDVWTGEFLVGRQMFTAKKSGGSQLKC